jgi:hypothetical protein
MPGCDATFDENSVPPWIRGDFRGVLNVGTTTLVLSAAVAVICRRRTRQTNHPRRGRWPRHPLLD